MAFFQRKAIFISGLFIVLAGCATQHIGMPQSRDEFTSGIKAGGLFRNTDQITVSRPVKNVVADVTEYADKCLNVRTTRAPDYRIKEAGGSTTYRPKIQTAQNGVTTLSVQEEYNNRQHPGVPLGGMFTLTAEIQAAANGKTQVNLYYIMGKGSVADSLKRWADGDKQRCPSLN
jgi:predicted secreted protein